jgi:DNA (cytosine-5)-methyltransferase 1
MNELALFAGAGGGILGGMLHGWRTVAAVEIEDYPRRVLLQRQADGILPRFPIWDDVRTFDGKQWRGKVNVVSGGFPCQDISAAGKGAGIEGERSGLWSEFARIIGEVRPRYVLVENSPMLVGRGLTRVLGDLAEMGYDARWGIIGAHHAGAPHKRDRIWIVGELADADTLGLPRPWAEQLTAGTAGCCEEGKTEEQHLPDTENERLLRRERSGGEGTGERGSDGRGEAVDAGRQWWATEPRLGRVAHGVAHRVDRLKAIGNGQVPAVVRLAWETLAGG